MSAPEFPRTVTAGTNIHICRCSGVSGRCRDSGGGEGGGGQNIAASSSCYLFCEDSWRIASVSSQSARLPALLYDGIGSIWKAAGVNRDSVHSLAEQHSEPR